MERRLGSAFLGLFSAAVGAALFVYGVLFVKDSVGFLGVALTVGGMAVAVVSAIRARRRMAASIVAAITMFRSLFSFGSSGCLPT
jgi:VIT1/CCC1 family predicted Fe2+/Mn2+ transporter